MSSIDQFFPEIETLIRQGKLKTAVSILQKINLPKNSTLHKLTMANYCRRLNLNHKGLIILEKQMPKNYKATTIEEARVVAEYAILLSQNGSAEEGQKILALNRKIECVDILLASAWCHFEKWEYAEALPELLQYVKDQTDPYLRHLGLVNLAETQLHLGSVPACLRNIKLAIHYAEKHNYDRLLANCLQLRGQAYSQLGEMTKSEFDLQRALHLFGQNESSDSLLITRQIAFNKAKISNSVKPIIRFSEKAKQMKAWESLRECDLHLLTMKFESKLFHRLYFGTPSSAYRNRLRKLFPTQQNNNYFSIGSEGAPNIFDSEKLLLNGKKLLATKQTKLLLEILISDFYRPISIGGIFTALFPSENYDCHSSPQRIHQALKRFRKWLAGNKIPATLLEVDGRYSLQLKTGLAIQIRSRNPLVERNIPPIEILRSKLASPKPFTSLQARALLGVSKATINRILKDALDLKQMEKTGKGRNTLYHF